MPITPEQCDGSRTIAYLIEVIDRCLDGMFFQPTQDKPGDVTGTIILRHDHHHCYMSDEIMEAVVVIYRSMGWEVELGEGGDVHDRAITFTRRGG